MFLISSSRNNVNNRNRGRPNANNDRQGFMMIPLRDGANSVATPRTAAGSGDNGDGGDGDGDDGNDSEYGTLPSDNNDNDNNNNDNNDARNGTEEVLIESEFNINNNEQEQSRRQQILRLGVMMTLIFLLLDGTSSGNASNSKNNSHTNSNNQSPLELIQLPKQETQDLLTVLQPLQSNQHMQLHRQNVTGTFRGYWRNTLIDSHFKQFTHNNSIQ